LPAVSRRHLQVVLGTAWLLDGSLQLQPFMFSRNFTTGVLEPTAAGQPHLIAVSVLGAAHLMARHLAFYNTGAALIQVTIGAGLLFPRTVKAALLISFGWAGGVWAFGEGFGLLLTGQANPLTGAPGPVLLYVLAGLMLWPVENPTSRSVASQGLLDDYGGRLAWAVLWIGFATLSLQPASLGSGATSAALNAGASISPAPLARVDTALSGLSAGHGLAVAIVLAAVELGIGVGMFHDNWRNIAALAGAAFAIAIWVTAQGLGGLATGQATDPNSGPLLVLMAAVLYVPVAARPRTESRAILRRREEAHAQKAPPRPACGRRLGGSTQRLRPHQYRPASAEFGEHYAGYCHSPDGRPTTGRPA
jgi:hypothetical protein